ncbi:hypothetical protein MACH05_25220 [Qipengyuania nanhaisediminis]
MRVMVVEDDAVLGLALEDALTREEFAEVTVCATAASSLQKLREESYDAVVLDVHLADDHEGWEIAELVDALGDKEIRIVFQTGAPRDIPEHIRSLGPVLSKPYDPQELIAALKQSAKPGLLSRLRRS